MYKGVSHSELPVIGCGDGQTPFAVLISHGGTEITLAFCMVHGHPASVPRPWPVHPLLPAPSHLPEPSQREHEATVPATTSPGCREGAGGLELSLWT